MCYAFLRCCLHCLAFRAKQDQKSSLSRISRVPTIRRGGLPRHRRCAPQLNPHSLLRSKNPLAHWLDLCPSVQYMNGCSQSPLGAYVPHGGKIPLKRTRLSRQDKLPNTGQTRNVYTPPVARRKLSSCCAGHARGCPPAWMKWCNIFIHYIFKTQSSHWLRGSAGLLVAEGLRDKVMKVVAVLDALLADVVQ